MTTPHHVKRQLFFDTSTQMPNTTLAKIDQRKSFHIDKANIQVPLPSQYDIRQNHKAHQLSPIATQNGHTSSSTIAATHALADRWAIWNNQHIPTLDTNYMTTLLTTDVSLIQAWMFLQSHGTIIVQSHTPSKPVTSIHKPLTGLRTRDVYHIPDQHHIQADLYNHGPLTTTFPITQRFLSFWEHAYNNDSHTIIYDFDQDLQSSPPASIGTHAARIMGWGDSNGTPYWLLANSWGAQTEATPTEYVRNGYFLAKRGKGLLEQNTIAGLPFIFKKDTQPQCCAQKHSTLFKNITVVPLGETTLYRIGHSDPPPNLQPLALYHPPSTLRSGSRFKKQPPLLSIKPNHMQQLHQWVRNNGYLDPFYITIMTTWVLLATLLFVYTIHGFRQFKK